MNLLQNPLSNLLPRRRRRLLLLAGPVLAGLMLAACEDRREPVKPKIARHAAAATRA